MVADLRMKALRLEEKEDWGAARDAWQRAIAELGDAAGPITEAMRTEFAARALTAHHRADEPYDRPAFKTQALAETKPGDDPDPGAAQPLDPGETQTTSGAI
jgi:hypothetical protein